MKKLQMTGFARAMRASRRAYVLGLAMAAMGAAQAADSVEIQVWHTLSGPNKAEFEKLAKQFNKEQDDVVVKLRDFGNQDDLKKEAASAVKSKKGPNLVQLADNHSPEVVAEHKGHPAAASAAGQVSGQDLNWFLPSTTSFTRDGKGRLLAFPWMAEVPVMFYNTAYYKKAGLDPNKARAHLGRPAGRTAQAARRGQHRLPVYDHKHPPD